MFRVLPWSPKGKIEDVAQRVSPFWVEILGVQPEFWPFLSHILKPLGSVLQVEDTKITLPHLNARVLLAPNPGIGFPENISVNFEGEPFIWKINKLGDIGACFHYKSNGHSKKECPLLKNISKEFRPSSNEKSHPKNDNNKADVGSSPSSGTIDTHVDGFVTLNNPLFEEEYEVRSASTSTPNQNNNNDKNPLYMPVPRSKNDDSSGKKNAQQIALEKIKTVAQNGNENILPTSPLKHSSPPPVGNLPLQSSEISLEARNMEKYVGIGEGFIEVVKKKKRKTYDRSNSLKYKEKNNKAKGNDMPDCFSRLYKNNPPYLC